MRNLLPAQQVSRGVRAERERAFDEFVAARYQGLLRTALALCGDRQHAEDLTQIAFLRVHRSWRRVCAADDADAYLHTVLVNASRSWFRRRWHGEVPMERLPESAAGPDDAARLALRDALLRALGSLPAGQREVLALRYLADLSEAETARALGCSTGTVKSRASRALATLRESGLLRDDTNARTP